MTTDARVVSAMQRLARDSDGRWLMRRLTSCIGDSDRDRMMAALAQAEAWLSLKTSWTEAEHPRDRRGEFTDKHSGTVLDASGLSGDVQATVREVGSILTSVLGKVTPTKMVELPDGDSATARSRPDGSIGIHSDSSRRTLMTAIIHEYGHKLDRSVLGNEDEWFTQTSSYAELDKAFRASQTVKDIRNDKVEILKGDTVTRNQLLQGRELFARAFEQYVAKQSGNATLRDAVDSVRNDSLLGFQYWPDAEFRPIAAAMAKILP